MLAALDWTIAAGDAATAIELAGSLATYWHRRSRFSEGSGWLARALALPGDVSQIQRVMALNGLATLTIPAAKFDQAQAALAEALALARVHGDRSGEAQALNRSGVMARARGELERAEAFHEQALAILLRLGELPNAATAKTNLAMMANICGDHATAEQSYLEALKMI